MKDPVVVDGLAQFLHNTRTAFAVYQGNALLCREGAVSPSVRRQAARRLIVALRDAEHLRETRNG